MPAKSSRDQSFIKLSLKFLLLLFCFWSSATIVKAQKYNAGPYVFSIKDIQHTNVSFTARELKKGLREVTFKINNTENVSKELTISWSVPMIGVSGCWTTNGNDARFIRMGSSVQSNIVSQAPVVSVFGNNSINRYTFALSDAFHPINLSVSVNEEEARMNFTAKISLEKDKKNANYQVSILLDNRPVAYYRSLKQVSGWWAYMPVYKPATVPPAAKLPVYSTWYSYHQNFTEKEILDECTRARAIGYRTIILDDGWQTVNAQRGYAFTGDWMPERIADMPGLVKKIHKTGMKFMLWYSVPFMGYHSAAYNRFKGKYLNLNDHFSAGVLDPRYPQVRKFIVDKYLHDLKEWGLDGFKLDFIDSFTSLPGEPPAVDKDADFTSVYAAVDQLMVDIKNALTRAKPNIMIEFRQSYIGPAMRKYGNMFRAGDCPEGGMTNRVRTTDIKLLAGNTAVHSDMLMWNYHEPVNLAALQFLNVLFSVPQLSVRLDELPASHLNMIKFYTHYWLANKHILVDGDFKALNPEMNYPVLMSTASNKVIVGLYADQLVSVNGKFKYLDIINAKSSDNVLLEISFPRKSIIEIFDCQGKLIKRYIVKLIKGINQFKTPPSGLLKIR
jgi:alpha-galactosidase